jgi:hypothetical protein
MLTKEEMEIAERIYRSLIAHIREQDAALAEARIVIEHI